MKIYCPNCGVKGSADDSYSGRKIKCPKCQEMFNLTPDMAIDQREFLTADLDADSLAESVGQDTVQEESGLDLDSSLEATLPESEEDLMADSLDLNEEFGDVVDSAETLAAEDEEDDSLDWEDFGGKPDKEIAESEIAGVTDDLQESEGQDTVQEEKGLDIDSSLEVALPENEEDLMADSLDLSEEFGDVVDSAEPLAAEEEETSEELAAEEEDDDSFDWEEFGAELDKEIAESEMAGATDDLQETEAFQNEEGPVADLDESFTLDDKDNLATLTAPEVVMPLFVDDEKDDGSDEESTDVVDTAEVMGFADADFPEAEEEPDVIIGDDSDEIVIVEEEPYGFDKEQCWQCGKKDSIGEPFIAVDGRLYCTDCLPADESGEESIVGAGSLLGSGLAGEENVAEDQNQEEVEVPERNGQFTIGGVIRESWDQVKGIKGSVWAGSAIMYLVLLVIFAGGAFLLPDAALEPEGDAGLVGYLLPALLQVVTEVVSMLFIAGLVFMGIRKVAGDKVSWKMIFHGFSFTGKIIVMSILQFILVSIGFLLLILPGIYLSVGYAMAIPLIVDKNMSPWQALEASRKAVHKVWWKVAALYLVMCLIFLVAAIPLGIGLIWAWPMLMVAAGVVYHRLFIK